MNATLPTSSIKSTMKHCYANTMVLSEVPMVAVRSNALSNAECDHLIKLASGHMQRAKVSLDSGAAVLPGRSGSNTWLRYQDDAQVRAIGQRIAGWVGIPLENAEAIQVIHYGPEQKYGAHFDAYDLETDKGRRCCARGGQRLVTCLVYLNDVLAGGSTSFPKLGITVQAEKGKMVIFHNVDPQDPRKAHPLSLHGGDPVTEGEKWACNIWFREQPMSTLYQVAASKPLAKATRPPSRMVSNRATALFGRAETQLKARLEQQARSTLLLYWDTAGNQAPYDTQGYDRVVQILDRRMLNAVANKRKLGEAIATAGLQHLAPATFISVADALKSGLSPKVWFAKNPFGTAGSGMHCIAHDGLSAFELPEQHILQAGVDRLDTLAGKKYTIRSYVLIWNRQSFVYPDGIVIIHAPDYDETSTDYQVQINHAGYMDPASGVVMQSLSDTGIAADVTQRAQSLMVEMQPVLAHLLNASGPDTFAILGVDFLRQRDGTLQLIEINSFPNFNHTAHINRTVNVPMMTAAFGMMLDAGPTLTKLGEPKPPVAA